MDTPKELPQYIITHSDPPIDEEVVKTEQALDNSDHQGIHMIVPHISNNPSQSPPNLPAIYPEGFKIERRNSIYGESLTDDAASDPLPTFPKSDDDLSSLKQSLKKNALFSHMSDSNLNTVALAFEPLNVPAETIVVRQYEEGSSCYFVQSGKLDCSIQERGFICEYHAGDSFGEASIMYGNIRGATIKATAECQLWKLDRMTYKRIVLKSSLPVKSEFIEVFRKVEIFGMVYSGDLNEEVLYELAKHCQHLIYFKGSEIHATSTDKFFYILENGRISVEVDGKKEAEYCEREFIGSRNVFGLECGNILVKVEEESSVFRVPGPLLETILSEIEGNLRNYAMTALI